MTTSLLSKYIEKYPKKVAMSISESPPDMAATFINSLSDDLYEKVIGLVPLSTMMNLYHQLPPTRLSLYLQRAEDSNALVIFSHLSKAERNNLTGILPKHIQLRLRNKFSSTSIGLNAMIDTHQFTFSEGTTINDAIKKLEISKRKPLFIFTTDSNEKISGYMPAGQLLQKNKSMLLADAKSEISFKISIDSDIEAIIENKGWQYHEVLPVIDNTQHLVGTLDITTILDYLLEKQKSPLMSFLEVFAKTYMETIYNLINSFQQQGDSEHGD